MENTPSTSSDPAVDGMEGILDELNTESDDASIEFAIDQDATVRNIDLFICLIYEQSDGK